MSKKLVSKTSMNRLEYLNSEGYNGANEGTAEELMQIAGYLYVFSDNSSAWISKHLNDHLVEGKLNQPADLYNVYSEHRRDEINARRIMDRPLHIRVTGGGSCIPDGYALFQESAESDIYILSVTKT